jgi:hypothetical protein
MVKEIDGNKKMIGEIARYCAFQGHVTTLPSIVANGGR